MIKLGGLVLEEVKLGAGMPCTLEVFQLPSLLRGCQVFCVSGSRETLYVV